VLDFITAGCNQDFIYKRLHADTDPKKILEWFAEDIQNIDYANHAMEQRPIFAHESVIDKGIIQIIKNAQLLRKREVCHTLITALKEINVYDVDINQLKEHR
jgi:hypothetical protein